jgi:hypothetical protein
MWSNLASKYFYAPQVLECLTQQICHDDEVRYLSYDHVSAGMVFEQFIGIEDINGNDVYVGDIVTGIISENSLATMGTVVFDDHFLFYANKNYGGNTPIHKINKIRVIGNCHENQNLFGHGGE